MKNRKAFEEVVYQWIDKLIPGSPNLQIYKDLFASMDDEEFDQMYERMNSGADRLAIIAPNLAKYALDLDRNLKLAEELGHDFYQRLWMAPGGDVPTYLTNKKYMVVELPLRRQAQMAEKKISIPKDNKSIDELTGQPSGESKGSKISYPETQIMAALNLPNSLTEMLKYRGGDVKGFDAMNDAISKQGGVSMDALSHLNTTVESTRTLSIFLKCMHLDNTLMS